MESDYWHIQPRILRPLTFGDSGWYTYGSKIFSSYSPRSWLPTSFVLLGVVRERVALTMIYLDMLLYSAGGMIGTMHHVYFSGDAGHAHGARRFFLRRGSDSAYHPHLRSLEFRPIGRTAKQKSQTHFPHFWAVMFLASVGFWNFLGAGIFGFLINLPIVSYYEIGTALTANHGHASMMGVYGMLSVGLALFCQRYMIPESRWSDRAAKISFWSLNLGLAWMVFATLFPLGILQLYHSVSSGYFEARTLQFITGGANPVLEWLRLPGDTLIYRWRSAAASLFVLAQHPPQECRLRQQLKNLKGAAVHGSDGTPEAQLMLQNIDIEVLLGRRIRNAFLSLSLFSLEMVARYSHRSIGADAHCGFQIPAPTRYMGVSNRRAAETDCFRLCTALGSVSSVGARLQRLFDKTDLCTDSDKGREIEHNPEFVARVRAFTVPPRNLADLASFGGLVAFS